MKEKTARSLLIGLIILLGTMVSSAYADSISTTNVNELPGIISSERGRPTVVVLFSSGCPLSRNFWPGFLNFAKQVRGRNVAILVFSTDRNKANASDFVSNTSLPFNCYWVEPWSSGQLAATMRTTGVHVGKSFTLPLVVVLDSNGKVMAEWEGLQDISQVENALKSIHAL